MAQAAEDLLILAARTLVELRIPAEAAEYKTILRDLASRFPEGDIRIALAARYDFFIRDEQGSLLSFLVDSLRYHPEKLQEPASRAISTWAKLAMYNFDSLRSHASLGLKITVPPESKFWLVHDALSSGRSEAESLGCKLLLAYVIPLPSSYQDKLAQELTRTVGERSLGYKVMRALAQSNAAQSIGTFGVAMVGAVVLLLVIGSILIGKDPWMIPWMMMMIYFIPMILCAIWRIWEGFFNRIDEALGRMANEAFPQLSDEKLLSAMYNLVIRNPRVISEMALRPASREWVEFALLSLDSINPELFREVLHILSAAEGNEAVRCAIIFWFSRVKVVDGVPEFSQVPFKPVFPSEVLQKGTPVRVRLPLPPLARTHKRSPRAGPRPKPKVKNLFGWWECRNFPSVCSEPPSSRLTLPSAFFTLKD